MDMPSLEVESKDQPSVDAGSQIPEANFPDPVDQKEPASEHTDPADIYDVRDPLEETEETESDRADVPGPAIGAPEDPDSGAPDTPSTEPIYNDALLQQAEQVGISRVDAQRYGNPAALGAAIQHSANLINYYQQQAPVQSESEEDSDHDEEPASAYKLKLGEDESPEVAKALTGLNDHYNQELSRQSKEIKSLQSSLQGVQQASETQKRESVLQYQEQRLRQADQWFDDLGKEYGDLFGKGPIHGLQQGGKEQNLRLAVHQTVGALDQMYRNLGTPVDAKEIFSQAVAAQTTGQSKQIARREIAGKLNKRSSQSVSRPTHRESHTEPDGVSKATKAVARMFRERGFSSEDDFVALEPSASGDSKYY